MPQPTRRAALQHLGALTAFAAVPTLAALSGCQTAPPAFDATDTDHTVAWLRGWLASRLARERHANLSVGVIQGERVVWTAAHGEAQPAHDDTPARLATPRTRYRAGSITKVFTALAVMRLHEQGRLGLDTPLVDLLPDWRPPGDPATLRRVTPRLILCHHSGLPGNLWEGMWSDAPADDRAFVALASTQPLAFAPGEVYAYANLGFGLLGVVIARATGEPLATWLQREVLQPLGMADSELATLPPTGNDAAFARDAQGQWPHEPALRDTGAGGLNTTALDLLQFARLWWAEAPGVCSAAGLQAMQTPVFAERLIDTATVGLGWHLITDEFQGLGPVLWHAGGTIHHHSELVVVPRLQLAVAVLSSAQAAGALAHDVAVEAVRRMAQAQTGRDPLVPPRTGVEAAHPPQPLAAMAGVFDTSLGVVRVDDEGRITSPGEDGPTLRLGVRPDGYAHVGYRLLGLLPVGLGVLGDMAFTRERQSDGQDWLLVRRHSRFMIGGSAVPPVAWTPAWRARTGTYRYDGPSAVLRQWLQQVKLMADGEVLALHIPSVLRVALSPQDEDTARVAGWGRDRGDTLRFATEGEQVVMHYSGMRLVRTGPA